MTLKVARLKLQIWWDFPTQPSQCCDSSLSENGSLIPDNSQVTLCYNTICRRASNLDADELQQQKTTMCTTAFKGNWGYNSQTQHWSGQTLLDLDVRYSTWKHGSIVPCMKGLASTGCHLTSACVSIVPDDVHSFMLTVSICLKLLPAGQHT